MPKFQIGYRVRLRSFHNKLKAPKRVDPEGNAWLLIGWEGTVVSTDASEFMWNAHKEQAYLIQFDKTVVEQGLHCHNHIENSLWLRESDLELLEQ